MIICSTPTCGERATSVQGKGLLHLRPYQALFRIDLRVAVGKSWQPRRPLYLTCQRESKTVLKSIFREKAAE